MRSKLAAISFFATLAVTPSARGDDKKIDICVANFEEAQLKEKRGKLVEARELYAMCAAASCPSMVRTDCAAKRDRLDKTTPSITIILRDAAGHDVAATIAIDGKPLTGDRTRAQPVDPGAHVITYTAPGNQAVDENVTVYEGEQGRAVNITAKNAPAAAATPTTASPAPPEQPAGEPNKPLVVPVVLAGIGIASAAVGIVFEVLAANEQSKSESFQKQADDPTTAPSQRTEFQSAASSRHDASKNDTNIGIFAVIGGVLFIGAGVLWYVLAPAQPQKSGWTAPGVYRF